MVIICMQIGVTGFEPTAARSQSGCSTKLSYTPLTMHLSVCYVGATPNILTVYTGVRRRSSANIQRGLIPNLQDSDGPVAEWHLWLERLKSSSSNYNPTYALCQWCRVYGLSLIHI